MGTTADKLQAILDVKNALKAKFAIPDNVAFRYYHDSIVGGEKIAFYKCASVTPRYDIDGNYFDIIMYIGGTEYRFVQDTSNVDDDYGRSWVCDTLANTTAYLCYSSTEEVWCIANQLNPSANHMYHSQTEHADDPRQGTWVSEATWIVRMEDVIYTKEIINGGTWAGYRAHLTADDNPYYVFDTVLSEGLTYTGNFIPTVGLVYDADITMQALFSPSGSGAGGEIGEFYLCSYVNRNYFSYNTIVVSGMPTDAFVGATYTNQETWESADVPADVAARNPNGTYTLTNPDEKYPSNFVWQSANGCVIAYQAMNGGFAIEPSAEYKGTGRIQMSSEMGSEYPVPEEYNTSNKWVDSSWNTIEGGSVAVPAPAPVEQYWEGYKLIQNEEGKWEFATELTHLTYGSFMPVAGRIYDGGCTMEITNANLSEDALWSCPHGMTANENDEWVITASSYYESGDDKRLPYMAFDGNFGTRWYVGTGPFWIQWQNKNRKVLIKQLILYMASSDPINGDTYLQGSNDGANWVDVFTDLYNNNTQEYINGLRKFTFDITKQNCGFYYYYRLGNSKSATANIYDIEAYAQIPREVPK